MDIQKPGAFLLFYLSKCVRTCICNGGYMGVRRWDTPTSRATRIRFQRDKVRLLGLWFNKINPYVFNWTQSGCVVMKEKHHFSVVTHLNPVSQPGKHLLKNNFLHHFLFLIRPFLEKWIILMYHSPVRYFLELGNSQTEVFWIWSTSQLAPSSKSPVP